MIDISKSLGQLRRAIGPDSEIIVDYFHTKWANAPSYLLYITFMFRDRRIVIRLKYATSNYSLDSDAQGEKDNFNKHFNSMPELLESLIRSKP